MNLGDSMTSITLTSEKTSQGSLILVNPDYAISASPKADDLVPAFDAFPHILMEKQAVRMLHELFYTLQSNGQIVPVSGYRPHTEQVEIWNTTLAAKGFEFTSKYVAVPGHSEHETGLAIDLAKAAPAIDFIRPDFPRTGVCQSFRSLAPKFGFIERYSKEKVAITHIGEEPWHFRYVGFPHAIIITQMQLSLEEYISFLSIHAVNQPFCYRVEHHLMELHYLPMEGNEKRELTFSGDCPHTLSGTNTHAYVLCRWRNDND